MSTITHELRAVVALLETKRMLTAEGEGCAADHYLRQYESAAAAFLRQHAAEIERALEDSARLDWLERYAHCADWDDHQPMRRVIRADDGEESCADTWREAIDTARADTASGGDGEG